VEGRAERPNGGSLLLRPELVVRGSTGPAPQVEPDRPRQRRR